MTLTVMPSNKPPNEKRGRPDKITDEVQEKILAAVRNHQRVEVAAELAGCSRETFYGALRAAAKAEEKLKKGAKLSSLTQYERKAMDFSASLLREMARSEADGILTITRAATTSNVTETTKTKCLGMDDNGQPIMVTETTRTVAPGDWRAMAWYQEHRPHSPYRSKQTVELTGADGGPIAIEFASRLEALEGRIKGQAIPVESEEVDPS